MADAYSGYNKVTAPSGSERAGCLAHPRRRFFDAQSAASEAAKTAMDFVLDVYRIGRAALDADLFGTPEHLETTQAKSTAGWTTPRPGSSLSWMASAALADGRRDPLRAPQLGSLTLFLAAPPCPSEPMAAKNRPLGRFEVVNIPSAPRGVPQIEITFAITERSISLAARDLTRRMDQKIVRVSDR